MTTATEGIGTSVWLPIKDYWGDEPDNGVTFTVISPKDLTGVSNGRLIEQRTENGKNVSVWEVKTQLTITALRLMLEIMYTLEIVLMVKKESYL